MSIWTQVFLINIIALLGTAALDAYTGDAIERSHRYAGVVLRGWATATLVSVPAWLIYLIIVA